MVDRLTFSVEIVAYMLAFGIGVGLVPWLLLGELCPAEVNPPKGSFTAGCCSW